jgi:DNA-binding NarL/FixJ family response regulator
MTILLLSRDLLFPSRVRAIAQQEGLEIEIVRSPEQLIERLDNPGTELVLVDLTCPGISLGAVQSAARQSDPGPRLVGFGPHVQEALLESARDAGFDQVLGNGEFNRTMASVLRGEAVD